MAQTKYKMPKPVRIQCIQIVRDYDRLKREYDKDYYDILYGQNHSNDGQPKGNKTGNPTQSKAERIDELKNATPYRQMVAVEQASLSIGERLEEEEREKLKDAVWDSCINGKKFSFNYTGLDMGSTCFYDHRAKFLLDIAIGLGLLKRRTVLPKRVKKGKKADCASKK